MEEMFAVKEEYGSSSSSPRSRLASDDRSPPRPMEGLREMGPPPFLTKTFDMVDDSVTDGIVSWSRGGQSFVVWDPQASCPDISGTVICWVLMNVEKNLHEELKIIQSKFKSKSHHHHHGPFSQKVHPLRFLQGF